MTLNPGDLLETAIWIDGRETVEQRARFEDDLRTFMARAAERDSVIIGPLVLHELKPGEERVPQVPDQIQGPNVRLLVAEAKVVGHSMAAHQVRLSEDLEPDDLARLRAITRRAYERCMLGQPRLTNRQCDTIINDLGPEAAADALRQDSVKLDRVLH